MLTWSVALSVFGTGLLSAESAWRALGYRPSAVDSPALWKYWYERAAVGGPKSIVLIGASRIQAGISTHQMRKQLPDNQVVQLGQYAGDSPVGVLRTIAQDQRFNGIVICDMLAPFLIRDRWESQRRLYESTATIKEQCEAYESARAADLLAINNSESGLRSGVKELAAQGRLPFPNHVRMRADRSLEINFALMNNLEGFRRENADSFLKQYLRAEHPAPEDIDGDLRELDGFVRRIQDRGGRVVFVGMPSSGERLKIEEKFHPKTKYWDRFAATSSGTCIHWAEFEGAGRFICPDDSHLDYRDAVQFTDTLIAELSKRGVLKAR